jgi:hypothetical protein
MRITNLYYKVIGEWLNAIKNNKDPFWRDYYKFWLLYQMSLLNSVWILTIDTLLWYFDFSISKTLSLSQDKIIGGLQLMFITVAPFMVLNYFLIFYKGKYKQLMVTYNTGNKKLLGTFIIGTMVVFLLAVYSHYIMKIFTGNEYLPGL